MKKSYFNFAVISIILLIPIHGNGANNMMNVVVSSPSFSDGDFIPEKYTCDGVDISPAIFWDKVPEGTASIAILVDDPDAPRGDWVHWIVYNLAPDMKGIPENFSQQISSFKGVREGLNDFSRKSYGGPCPPHGVHRYFFKVYFLNTLISESNFFTKQDLLKAVAGHVVGYGELVGKYKKK